MGSLVCTKGQYSGANIAVNGSLSIGRDPNRCQLVISNAQGISSVHCDVRTAGNGLTLTDMGSTNGTFVNGRRLAANETVVLNNGDRFFLANGSNEFKIIQTVEQPQPQSAPVPQQIDKTEYLPPVQQYAPPPQQQYEPSSQSQYVSHQPQ